MEQPTSVALGAAFLAVATDAQVVHLFSTGGVHMDELAAGGPVVALAAQGPLLAMVWHRAPPLHTGEQCLDILVRQQPQSSQLLSCAHLTGPPIRSCLMQLL